MECIATVYSFASLYGTRYSYYRSNARWAMEFAPNRPLGLMTPVIGDGSFFVPSKQSAWDRGQCAYQMMRGATA